MQKISPFLWFDGRAEEAMNFYVSVFPNARVLGVVRYGDAGPGPKGSVMTASFEIQGQPFTALNGGPQFTFNPAVSFVVNCESQQEVDHLWDKLPAGGGKTLNCGWLQDRFGLSWQIVPVAMLQMLQDKDPEKANRAMEAMLKMNKLDIAALKRAHEGKA
jgi:predicted 3-demethylubiquinone-9 3-methyltransferase (glyoxalase superfamily)